MLPKDGPASNTKTMLTQDEENELFNEWIIYYDFRNKLPRNIAADAWLARARLGDKESETDQPLLTDSSVKLLEG